MSDVGQKFDGGKPKMSRFPLRACIPVVRVLEFGKHKYGAFGGWQKVPEAEERYTDAFFRHVADLQEYGLRHIDADSGLPTLAHAVCDGVFLLWFAWKEDPGRPWLKKAEAPKTCAHVQILGGILASGDPCTRPMGHGGPHRGNVGCEWGDDSVTVYCEHGFTPQDCPGCWTGNPRD